MFGTTADGRGVEALEIAAGRLRARILQWGAVLQDLRLDGVAHGVTLGSERLADYEGAMRFHGAIIAPVVNRISGARATIDGREYRLEANLPGGITLHSGTAGTHLKVWEIADRGPAHAVLTVALPDGEGGFPGNRRLAARFEALSPATLRLTLSAETDAPTLMNAANHSYWNLDGTADFAGHRLRLAADRYLPATPRVTPRGPVVPVGGTPYDLRRGARLAPGAPPLDTCFCLADARRPLTEVLALHGCGGVTLRLATTEPGLQLYDARDARRPGGGPCEGLAIEAQFWPDAPNHPRFPAITLRPGEPWAQVTEWRFSGP
jgi:aldose 1-epimerase